MAVACVMDMQRAATKPTLQILTNCYATVSTTHVEPNVRLVVLDMSKRNGNLLNQMSISCVNPATVIAILQSVNMTQKWTEEKNPWIFMGDTLVVVSVKIVSILLKASTVRDVVQDTTMTPQFP